CPRHATGTATAPPARKARPPGSRRDWASRGQVSAPAPIPRGAMVFCMPKTLVIAEKPSVGRDLAGALDGPFQKRKLDDIKPKRGKKKVEEPTNEEVVEAAKSKTKAKTTRDEAVFLESDDYVITWA